MEKLNRQLKLLNILKTNNHLTEICVRLNMLTKEKNNTEMEEIIKSLNLPLKEHLFIMGNFSDLMSLDYNNKEVV